MNLRDRLPFFLALANSNNYVKLEYIESDGNAYIDTGIIATINSGVRIEYEYTNSGNAGICGIYQPNSPRTDALFITTNSGQTDSTTTIFTASRGATTGTVGYPNVELNKKYIARVNYLNDGKMGFENISLTDVGTNEVYNTHTIQLFARYNTNNGSIAASHSKIYSAVFTENNAISHSYIPVKRTSDGTVGLYDEITHVFLTNAGTGTFYAGPVISLPKNYRKMDYLESTGTQYLISDYIVNNKSKVYFRYLQTNTVGSPDVAQAPIGVTDMPTPNAANNGILRLINGSSNFNRVGWGSNTAGSVIDITGYNELNTWYEVYYNLNEIYINSNLVATSSTNPVNPWSANYGLGIFARNGTSVTMKSKVRISNVWAKEDNTYTLYLIPARRFNDNALGMYDTVSGQFLTNQGTGKFIIN